MGQFADLIQDDVREMVRRQFGEDPDPQALRRAIEGAVSEIQTLTGRDWGRSERVTATINSGGLPFAAVPDLQRASLGGGEAFWAVPDVAHPHMSTVIQLGTITEPAAAALPTTEALWAAGSLANQAARRGMLSDDYILHRLGAVPAAERMELLRQIADPWVIHQVPVLGAHVGGWWVQISRRIRWLFGDSSGDAGRLVQPLLPDADPPLPLVGEEPVLILARLTNHPVIWAQQIRVWTEEVPSTSGRPWHPIARAIHGYGVPVVRIDASSTPEETGCALVLIGRWHGWFDANEPGLGEAVVRAFPAPVARIRRRTGVPDDMSAAAMLLEGLLFPGFDPSLGADSNRRYVARKASIAVMNHRKAEAASHPWTDLGIDERRFYKLLPQFSSKVAGRYEVDADVLDRIRTDLERREQERDSGCHPGRPPRAWLQRGRCPQMAAAALTDRGPTGAPSGPFGASGRTHVGAAIEFAIKSSLTLARDAGR